MTKHLPTAIAFNRRYGRMRHRWPVELVGSGQFLRLELFNARLPGWRKGGGAERLGSYLIEFEPREIAWVRARQFKAGFCPDGV